VPVVRNLSLEVPSGATVALVGPSGGGKSTLLRTLAGILAPLEGQFHWGEGLRPRTWYVAQTPALLPFRTTIENVALAREAFRAVTEDDMEHAQALLDRLGLGAAADVQPANLSGGMRRRAALGQALFAESDVLLLDEPFAELDLASRRKAEATVAANRAERRQTLIFATHDLDSAAALADVIAVIADGLPEDGGTMAMALSFPSLPKPPERRADPNFPEAIAGLQAFVTRTVEASA
jgi:NitT/TauT family transport system ATP-binding protein